MQDVSEANQRLISDIKAMIIEAAACVEVITKPSTGKQLLRTIRGIWKTTNKSELLENLQGLVTQMQNYPLSAEIDQAKIDALWQLVDDIEIAYSVWWRKARETEEETVIAADLDKQSKQDRLKVLIKGIKDQLRNIEALEVPAAVVVHAPESTAALLSPPVLASNAAAPTFPAAVPASNVAAPTFPAAVPASKVATTTFPAAVPASKVAAPTFPAAVPASKVAAPTFLAAVPAAPYAAAPIFGAVPPVPARATASPWVIPAATIAAEFDDQDGFNPLATDVEVDPPANDNAHHANFVAPFSTSPVHKEQSTSQLRATLASIGGLFDDPEEAYEYEEESTAASTAATPAPDDRPLIDYSKPQVDRVREEMQRKRTLREKNGAPTGNKVATPASEVPAEVPADAPFAAKRQFFAKANAVAPAAKAPPKAKATTPYKAPTPAKAAAAGSEAKAPTLAPTPAADSESKQETPKF